MNFLYEATDTTGNTVLGKIDGTSLADVQLRLLRQGYRPLTIAPTQETQPPQQPPALPDATPQNRTIQTASAEMAQGSVNNLLTLPEPAPLTTTRPPTPTVGASRVTGAARIRRATTLGNGAVAVQKSAQKGGIIMAGNAARLGTQTHVTPKTRTHLARPAPATATSDLSKLGGVKTRDQMFFFRQLGSLVHSGMSVYSALENLAGRTRNPNLARTAREMAEAARTGGQISEIMATYPRIYADHIVGMVRAGELGGFLEIALDEIANVYEQNIALYRGAWVPKLMATQAFFIFAVAQPLFPTLFPNNELIVYLKLVLLRNIPITCVLYLLIRFAGSTLQLPKYRYLRDDWALRVQPFGKLQRLSALNAFIRVLRRLYSAGLSPGSAWEGAMNTASNVVIRDKLSTAYLQMQQGASLGDAFQTTELFGDSVEQLVFTGQQSGMVVESLEQVGNYYQQELEEARGRVRFMMLRLGFLAMLLLGGGTMIYMMKTYFKSIFDFAAGFEPKD